MTDDKLDGKTICARCVHVYKGQNNAWAVAPHTWECKANAQQIGFCYVSGLEVMDFEFCRNINTDGECKDYEEVQGDEDHNPKKR